MGGATSVGVSPISMDINAVGRVFPRISPNISNETMGPATDIGGMSVDLIIDVLGLQGSRSQAGADPKRVCGDLVEILEDGRQDLQRLASSLAVLRPLPVLGHTCNTTIGGATSISFPISGRYYIPTLGSNDLNNTIGAANIIVRDVTSYSWVMTVIALGDLLRVQVVLEIHTFSDPDNEDNVPPG